MTTKLGAIELGLCIIRNIQLGKPLKDSTQFTKSGKRQMYNYNINVLLLIKLFGKIYQVSFKFQL